MAILDTCGESLKGIRDRALLLFAWASGGRRRSEVTGATMKNLHRVGPNSFTYTLAYSKSTSWTMQYLDKSGKADTLVNPSPLLLCEILFESWQNLPGSRRCFLRTR